MLRNEVQKDTSFKCSMEIPVPKDFLCLRGHGTLLSLLGQLSFPTTPAIISKKKVLAQVVP